MASLLTTLRNRLADASIYFSFDRSGFERHARRFEDSDLEVDLGGRRVLVTGANSGIGKAAARWLAELGAEVWLLCRNEERGQAALDELRETVEHPSGARSLRLERIDLASLASVRDFAQRVEDDLSDRPPYALVHNAGNLTHQRRLTEDSIESTWATHVVGPFLLTHLMVPHLRAFAPRSGTRARVVTVTSGGMYTQKLDLDDVRYQKDFDGVVAYAQAKRAQTILTEMWAERWRDSETGAPIDASAMHPGWVDTPGVRESLPRFWRFTRNRLRTPRQGADTVVWLVATERLEGTSGQLFFDRKPVRTHLLPWTRESAETRRALWRKCEGQAGLR